MRNGILAVVIVALGCGKAPPPPVPTVTIQPAAPPVAVQPVAAPVQPVAEPAKPEPKPEPEPPPVQFDIGGTKIGDPLTVEWVGDKVATDVKLRVEARMENKGKLTEEMLFRNPEFSCGQTIEFEGGEILIDYQFLDRRLIGVSLYFKSELFPLLVKSYTAKLAAPPHEVFTDTVTTKAGVNYQNEKAIWQTTNGPFILEKYAGDIESGLGMLLTPEAAELQKGKEAAKTSELEKKL